MKSLAGTTKRSLFDCNGHPTSIFTRCLIDAAHSPTSLFQRQHCAAGYIGCFLHGPMNCLSAQLFG